MISLIWSRISGYVAAFGFALAVIAGAFLYGRSGGKADAEAAIAKSNAKAVKQAREVEDATNKMGGNSIDRDLAKWMRDGKR